MIGRTVTRTLEGQETYDGAGVRLRRTIGSPALDHVDPFLLLDEFRSDSPDDYIGGFPDHPHRGFETVTYMIAGRMRHKDHRGNQGDLGPGSAQWMTAGRGIVHSEMPQQENGLMWGFQLWVNLPAADKMTEPRYQDIPGGDIPEVDLPGGGRARVVAGRSHGTEGAVKGIATAPLYVDIALPAGGKVEHPVPAGHHAFVYPFEGEVRIGDRTVGRGVLAILGDGDSVTVEAGESGGRFLLVAARPLGEPIARRGPFVMNTDEEIRQAFQDYKAGRLAT